MNYNKDPESWARVSPLAAVGGSMAQAENVLTMALEDIAKLSAQLNRANRIIAWMCPYIGSMCPPKNGLFEFNEHCCDNLIRPNDSNETKGRPINQRARG